MLSYLSIFLSISLLDSSPLSTPRKENVGQLSGLPSLERRSQPDDDELATDDSAELEVNLGLILKQSQDIFDSEGSGKPFGLDGFYLQESPSFSDFNNLFKRRPSQPTRKSPAKDEIGEFASLGTGEPWDKFRNIFLLYGKPQQEGHVEIFGPVYGENQGCGLCNLFPKFEVADFVTLELISEPVQTTATYQEHELLPGGQVSLLNGTCIQVLDDDGAGVFFKLNAPEGLADSSEGDKEGDGN